MFKIILFFFKLLLRKKPVENRDNIVKISVLEKEVEILKRRLNLQNKRVRFQNHERLIFAMCSTLTKTKDIFTIVKPNTVLKWYKSMIKKKWTYPKTAKRVGRPPISSAVKHLILKLKNSNILWGNHRISDELEKLNIEACHESVRKIIAFYRRKGKVKKSLTWSKFLKSHWNSIFAMDTFTVSALNGKRFYILVFIELKTRKIVQFAITEHPVKEFVRQQIIKFTDSTPGIKYLIHDRAPEFCAINYSAYKIKAVKTSVKSPNMNSYVERVIGTIQREALDWFIIFNRKQLYNIIKEYVHYYNNYRPHQGIGKIPVHDTNQSNGKIRKKPILKGLHNHYFRAA